MQVMKPRRHSIVAPFTGVAISAVLTATTLSAAPAERATLSAGRLSALTLETPLERENVSLAGPRATGAVQIIARLRSAAVGEGRGSSKAQLQAEQAAFIARAQSVAPNARVLGSVQLVLNAVFLEVDASEVDAIARDVAVTRVAAVGDYQTDLTETVPYIGAAALQGAGGTGAGVRVAVIDSGVDYTHANLGGAGTVAAYTAAYGANAADARNTTLDGLFPT